MNLNQYGLICNIIGTIIIAFWGLPNWYYSPDGGQIVTRFAGNPKAISYNKRKKILAWIGILLVLAGFLLQFAYSIYH
jgi:hypothetical protein